MKLVSLSCNNCEAPLEIPESKEFIICSQCNTKQIVHKNENSVDSVVVEEMQEEIKDHAKEIEIKKLQNELKQLDLQWHLKKENFNSKYGTNISRKSVISIKVVHLIFGIIWTLIAIAANAPFIFPLVGAAFVLSGLYFIHSENLKLDNYNKNLSNYKIKRNQLLHKLAKNKY